MTVAERMRRDGWRNVLTGWTRCECGVWLFVNTCGWIAKTPWLPDYERPAFYEVAWGQGAKVGLRSLAQRAKAKARELARKRRSI